MVNVLMLSVQIISIIAAIFGIVFTCIDISKLPGFSTIVLDVLILLYCLMLLFVEIYIFPCFRFFGFLLKNWGKALSYLIMGFLIFNYDITLRLVAGIIYWVLAVVYIVFTFICKGISYPLAQRGGKITLQTSSSDYYVEA